MDAASVFAGVDCSWSVGFVVGTGGVGGDRHTHLWTSIRDSWGTFLEPIRMVRSQSPSIFINIVFAALILESYSSIQRVLD